MRGKWQGRAVGSTPDHKTAMAQGRVGVPWTQYLVTNCQGGL